MLTIDLLDSVQDGHERVDVANLRKARVRTMRESAEGHALAIAWLVDDDAPEYAEKLVDYADEIKVA